MTTVQSVPIPGETCVLVLEIRRDKVKKSLTLHAHRQWWAGRATAAILVKFTWPWGVTLMNALVNRSFLFRFSLNLVNLEVLRSLYQNNNMWALVRMMAKGCIVAWVLSLRSFLFLLPNYTHIYAILMHQCSYHDRREVLQQEHSQPPILPSPHFQWVE